MSTFVDAPGMKLHIINLRQARQVQGRAWQMMEWSRARSSATAVKFPVGRRVKTAGAPLVALALQLQEGHQRGPQRRRQQYASAAAAPQLHDSTIDLTKALMTGRFWPDGIPQASNLWSVTLPSHPSKHLCRSGFRHTAGNSREPLKRASSSASGRSGSGVSAARCAAWSVSDATRTASRTAHSYTHGDAMVIRLAAVPDKGANRTVI